MSKNIHTKNFSTWRVIKYFWQQSAANRHLFYMGCIIILLVSTLNAYTPVIFKNVLDLAAAYTKTPNAKILSDLTHQVWVFATFGIIGIIGWRLNDLIMIPFEMRTMRSIYLSIFRYVHDHSHAFFANHFSGSILRQMGRLVRGFEAFTDILLYDFLMIIFEAVTMLYFLSRESVLIALVFLGFIVIFVTLSYFVYKFTNPFSIRANEKDTEVSGYLADTLANNINLKLFSSGEYERHMFDEKLKIWTHHTGRSWFANGFSWGVMGIFTRGFLFTVLFVGIILIGKGLLSVGMLGLIIIYGSRLIDYLWGVGNVFKRFSQLIGESAEMLDVLDTPHDVTNIEGAQDILIKTGKIELKNVNFAYTDGKQIFSDFSIVVRPGERVGLVGASGAGKSTLIKLLLRLVDINSGEILIDGQNIAEVTQTSLRKALSMVPQDPLLFHRSVGENIKYGRSEATQEEVVDVSIRTCCHDFISAFPEGYETLVGERGVKLSGGERQRVAIARALLENSPVFLLDEATSSLDSESEQLIQKALDEAMKGKTVIAIAHRLSTIMKMDRILVLDGGKIVEEGTHDELLAKLDGKYAELWNIQSGGYL